MMVCSSIRLLFIFFVCGVPALLVDDEDNSCRSNKTHIAWRQRLREQQVTHGDHHDEAAASMQQQRHLESSSSFNDDSLLQSSSSCHWQTMSEARKDSYRYLRNNVMKFDLPFLETMGFAADDDDDDDEANSSSSRSSSSSSSSSKNNALLLPDGLSDGMIGKTIDLALLTKIEFQHADQLPLDIFQEYVLNYANTNEARNNWRPLLWSKLRWLAGAEETTASKKDDDDADDEKSRDVVSRIVHAMNANMWTLLAPSTGGGSGSSDDYIYFKSGSTPMVFDPMSVMVYGYGSCTGVSILFCNALRTVGIPARVAGTAAWDNDRLHGNHNWIEVWKDGQWYFLEPSPQAAANASSSDSVDDLERSPCQRWFCSAERFGRNISQPNATLVFAARYTAITATTYYPVAWEWNNRDVPGEDVTEYYREHCGKCS